MMADGAATPEHDFGRQQTAFLAWLDATAEAVTAETATA